MNCDDFNCDVCPCKNESGGADRNQALALCNAHQNDTAKKTYIPCQNVITQIKLLGTLTGSRYFGVERQDSDWDYIMPLQDLMMIRGALIHLGFHEIKNTPTTCYGTLIRMKHEAMNVEVYALSKFDHDNYIETQKILFTGFPRAWLKTRDQRVILHNAIQLGMGRNMHFNGPCEEKDPESYSMKLTQLKW